jgi:hypothetical protein
MHTRVESVPYSGVARGSEIAPCKAVPRVELRILRRISHERVSHERER